MDKVEYEVFVDLRLTPSKIDATMTPTQFKNEYIKTKVFGVIKGWGKKGLRKPLTKEGNIIKYVLGEETLDSHGRTTHLHFHLHCLVKSEKTKTQIKSSLAEWCRNNGCKGTESYCLRTHDDTNKPDHWMRYPMKEKKYEQFNVPDHEELCMLAYDEKLRSVERNLKNEEIQKNKNQFRDKMWKHLDKNKIQGTKNIMREMCEYYDQNGRDPPLQDLANRACWYEIKRKYRNINDIFLMDKSGINYIE